MPPAASYTELTAIATARLGLDLARRPTLDPVRRSALDGIVHALRADSMVPEIPQRRLLYFLLDAPEPLAAVAVGDPDTATHVTFQVSGSGISAATAMWGSVREAGELYLAQRALGIERPCVISWLGYRPPGLVPALSGRAARNGARRLVADLSTFNRLRPDRSHLAIEAHSYGATLAAYALEMIRGSIHIDTLVTTGSAGSPRKLPRRVKQFDAVASGDLTSWLGRVLSGRRLAGSRFAVDARPGLGLQAVTGHNTSQYLPQGRKPRHGYRDGDTLCLRNLALITSGGQPLG